MRGNDLQQGGMFSHASPEEWASDLRSGHFPLTHATSSKRCGVAGRTPVRSQNQIA
jgi:hypothetical protein